MYVANDAWFEHDFLSIQGRNCTDLVPTFTVPTFELTLLFSVKLFLSSDLSCHLALLGWQAPC
jgi:hypothetical protein